MTQQKREFPPFDAQGQLFSLRTIRFWRSPNLRGWFCPGILTETLLALIAKWCSSPLECPFRLEETVMRKAILSVGLLLAGCRLGASGRGQGRRERGAGRALHKDHRKGLL